VTRPKFRPEVLWAVEAARNKKAGGVTVLDLAAQATFTDYFVICTGFSSRQVQSISDGIEEDLARRGVRVEHSEGHAAGEWVLLDYGSFVVHVFHERARHFYDLERLWRHVPRTDYPDADSPEARQP
jgi:iojap-like ribosome-associated protein